MICGSDVLHCMLADNRKQRHRIVTGPIYTDEFGKLLFNQPIKLLFQAARLIKHTLHTQQERQADRPKPTTNYTNYQPTNKQLSNYISVKTI